MTRINVGVDPRELPRRALLAEHREMKRIPNMLRSKRLSCKCIETFKLGPGHVLFFTTRMLYLHRRYLAVYAECKRRNYNVENFESSFKNLLKAGFKNSLAVQQDYKPTSQDRALVVARLSERWHVLKCVPFRDSSL